MRLAINGWFLAHPHTGSGQYLCALLAHLPTVAPDLRPEEVHVIAPAHVGEVALPAGCTLHLETNSIFNVTKSAKSAKSADKNQVRRTLALQKIRFEQLTFPRAAHRLGADLAHIPYWGPPLRSRVPFVVTVHDIIPLLLPEHRGSFLARLYTSLVTAATRGATLVIADSHHSRRDIVGRLHLPREKVRTVHLAAGKEYRPADTFEATPALRDRYNLPDSYVLYLGGFHRRKNVHRILTAWTWASDPIGEQYPLVIAGQLPPQPDGQLYFDLPALADELDIADTVRFIGPVDEADKPALYQGAACFVFPSSYEGFGLPPLEAMACGVPVVATGAASLPEVVGDAAYLVDDPADTRKLGAAILGVVVDEKLADDLRARGLKQAAKFSWEKTARETAEIYRTTRRSRK